MNRRAEIYIFVISIIGLALAAASCARYLWDIAQAGFLHEAFGLACAVILCSVTRAFPIRMRSNQYLDVSVIAILAIYLTRGMDATVFVWTVSSVILYASDLITAPKKALSRDGVMKLFLNNSNVTIAIVLSALLCEIFPWRPGMTGFPIVLLPTIIFSTGAFVFNALIMLTMFRLNDEITGRDILATMRGLTLNVLAAMPLGLLIAELLSLESGNWIAMVMLFPMLLARYAWQLYLDSQRQQSRLISAFVSTMEAKDTYTQGHSERVGKYAQMIARQLKFSEKQVTKLSEAAVLHDVGKIGIDDSILTKPGPLVPEEWEQMRQHPLIGVRIVEQVGLSPDVVEMIRDHHERFDGRGYPNGIAGEEIPLGARVLGVADAFDAMTSDRPYRSGMPAEEAIRILREESGKQFDGQIVEALIAAMEERK